MAKTVEKTLATAALYKDIVVAKKAEGTPAGGDDDNAREKARKGPAGNRGSLEAFATLFSLFLSSLKGGAD
ncbi:MAG: hypothetical protein GC185_11225 [Alphaproteobacteria bacterium]|nr:hypothetical protein [Alphaproteobacteria bacterium]